MKTHATIYCLCTALLWSCSSDKSAITSDPRDAGNPAQPVACNEPATHTSVATYYFEADGSGNCLFDATPSDPMVAALASNAYNGSYACGQCIQVDGPDGSVTVRVVDSCPDCMNDQVDLHPQAFDGIAARELGRVDITWKVVPCDVSGAVRFHFKDGSNPYWTAVQIRNHRHGVAKLEAKQADGSYQELPRYDYNYFVAEQGLGDGPYEFRVTDIYGSQITEAGIALGDNVERTGSTQFPECI
ncbi:MAG: hypothetical protein IPJ88_16655 [Myxococcales bacterium]|nr:MAG: hypothetical protein IPJ88_16655 [Myxococcales bacterium]